MRVAGAALSATLRNADAPDHALNLTIVALGDIVRVLVDEPGQARYQVPDILEPGVDALASSWSNAATTAAAWTGSTGALTVTLGFAPFRLDVDAGGKPALRVNSRDMFEFEHTRAKQVCLCSFLPRARAHLVHGERRGAVRVCAPLERGALRPPSRARSGIC